MKVTPNDLTIIYYTSNELDRTNPYFLSNTKAQLLKAVGDLPIVSVSHKPIDLGTNICLGEIGRSHLNLYKQILIGCKAAKTKFVAMAEDDILYSWEHFNSELPKGNYLYFDMNKWSVFTWIKPPQYTYRDRMVVNQLIAPRDYLVEALEERFVRVEVLKKTRTEEDIIHYWGDPGRYEALLGVTVRERRHFFSTVPSIVFTHDNAFGFLTHGTHKRLGNPRAYDIPFWGKCGDVMKLYDKNYA
jgi:hypothetical protein